MIGLDTNVLIRYIVQDDPAQSALATRIIETRCSESDPGWVNDIVLVELVWVLRRAYQYKRKLIAELLQTMLVARELEFSSKSQILAAVSDYRQGQADFSDYLIAHRNHQAGCTTTVTFDQNAGKHPAFERLS